jgi:hypothetical protein
MVIKLHLPGGGTVTYYCSPICFVNMQNIFGRLVSNHNIKMTFMCTVAITHQWHKHTSACEATG